VKEIKIQELVSNLSLGTLPRSIWVSLEDDLVDTCKPGDDVVVVGRARQQLLIFFTLFAETLSINLRKI
jgi:DNA helicase MCM9